MKTRWGFVAGVVAVLFAAPALSQGLRDCAVLRPSCPPASATTEADSARHGRGWVDLGAGAGWIHAARGLESASFALDFSAGFWLGERVGIGARAGGWTIEGFSLSDPQRGESVSEVLALLKLRPFGTHPVAITIAGGWAKYVASDPGRGDLEGNGIGWRAEVEWPIWRPQQWALSAALGASWGKIDPDSRAEPDFGFTGGAVLVRGAWLWGAARR